MEAGGPAQHEGELSRVERLADEPRIAPVVLELCLWIAAYYGSTPARALALALPPRVRAPSDTWVSATGLPAATAKRRALLDLLAGGPLPLAELVERGGTTAATVRRLAKDGLVALDARLRVPRVAAGSTPRPEELTEAQTAAVAQIEGLLVAGGGDLLLYGVTGSGKTEVYLRAAESTLARGRTVLVLVPEIALSPQTARRFAARFGDQVAVLHSGLSDGERRAVRDAAVSGDVRVVVGARSAVFAPLPRVGLIIVDEEHESAYKQGDDPRYDARRVAAKRARLEGAVLVMGTATPRPESWQRLPRATLPAGSGATCHASRSSISAATASIRSRGRCAPASCAWPTRAAAPSCCSTGAARRPRCTAAAAARVSAAIAATSAWHCTRVGACAATTAVTPSARPANAPCADRSSWRAWEQGRSASARR